MHKAEKPFISEFWFLNSPTICLMDQTWTDERDAVRYSSVQGGLSISFILTCKNPKLSREDEIQIGIDRLDDMILPSRICM